MKSIGEIEVYQKDNGKYAHRLFKGTDGDEWDYKAFPAEFDSKEHADYWCAHYNRRTGLEIDMDFLEKCQKWNTLIY